LLVGATVWFVAWCVGLALEKIPGHAVAPKYMIAAALPLLTIMVRSTATCGRRQRQAVLAFLLLALATAPMGWLTTLPAAGIAPGMGFGPLIEADALLVDVPKRGQLLPIVAKLRPEATVIIATPETAIANWDEVETNLPRGALCLLEIDAENTGEAGRLARTKNQNRERKRPAGERGRLARTTNGTTQEARTARSDLHERLRQVYNEHEVIRKGGSRRITMFRGRRDAAAD
jgi:hypothetical protein